MMHGLTALGVGILAAAAGILFAAWGRAARRLPPCDGLKPYATSCDVCHPPPTPWLHGVTTLAAGDGGSLEPRASEFRAPPLDPWLQRQAWDRPPLWRPVGETVTPAPRRH